MDQKVHVWRAGRLLRRSASKLNGAHGKASGKKLCDKVRRSASFFGPVLKVTKGFEVKISNENSSAC
jgi:hypothetical protein